MHPTCFLLPERRAPADYSWFLSVDIWRVGAPEKAMVLHTFLPEVLAVIPLVKIEFNDVLVVTLVKQLDEYFW